jgi:hypothetical protein
MPCPADCAGTTATRISACLTVRYIILLLHFLHQFDAVQNFSFTRLFQFPRQHEFIQDTVDLAKVEDNVEFADIAKVGIQQFDKQVNRLQIAEFIVRLVHGNGEKEAGIPPINELVGIVFNKVGILLVAGRHEAMDFGFNADLFRFARRGGPRLRHVRRGHVPLGQARLALTVLEQKKSNLCVCRSGRKWLGVREGVVVVVVVVQMRVAVPSQESVLVSAHAANGARLSATLRTIS